MSHLNPVSTASLGNTLPDTFPFESVTLPVLETTMSWRGNVGQAMDELDALAARPQPESLAAGYWFPSRVLRAVVDSRIEGPSRVELVNQTTTVALEVFAGVPDPDKFGKLRQMLGSCGLTRAEIVQKNDPISAHSSSSPLSLGSARRLDVKTKTSDPLLIMPLCHGGFSAGIQTALHYQRIHPEADTRIYPARMSRRKYGDTVLRLADDELNFVREIASNRTLAIFDEDACNGTSVLEAARFLKSQLPKTEIIGLVNNDFRYKDAAWAQGKWWQHTGKWGIRNCIVGAKQAAGIHKRE